MLPEKNRLKSSSNIQKVFKSGQKTQSGFLFLKILPNEKMVSRFAFAVGIKYSKSAVERNKLKRILRELTKKRLPKIKPGFDIVITPINMTPNVLDKKRLTIDLEKIFSLANLKINTQYHPNG